MFEKEIREYEDLCRDYRHKVMDTMGCEEYRKYNEVLYSAHSCAIEGNSFSVDDTRELKEKGLGVVPVGKSLLEAFEMLDHFSAYEYVMEHIGEELTEDFVKETNRLVVLHTLSYKCPGAVPGEYTDCDMAAGDTVFGDHATLIRQLPKLLSSTSEAMGRDIHPMIVAARFHGFFEYLHVFRDGNGRTGRLLANHILLSKGHPLLVITREDREEYINCLRRVRTEGTDEFLIAFFFKVAMRRMRDEINQKRANTSRMMGGFLF